MPLVTVTASNWVSDEERVAISNEVHEALVSEFGIATTDKFHVLLPAMARAKIVHPASHQGINYSDRIVIVQIVANNTPTELQKQRLCEAINKRVVAALSFRLEDIIINLLDVAKENWSFGYPSTVIVDQTLGESM